MSNQRRYERRSCAEPINICTATRRDRVGLARDLSPTGLSFQSPSKFAIGERVDLIIHISSVGNKTAVGRVVRTSATADLTSLFPHGAAVEFDAPRFDLVEPPTLH